MRALIVQQRLTGLPQFLLVLANIAVWTFV